MYNILNNYKRILFILIKLLIVVGAIYFLVEKLVSNKLLSFEQFTAQLSLVFATSIWYFLIVLVFTDANWILEIFKWKKLASIEKKISFFDAYKQCFASLTASIITPNRIGEYGAKALYFKKGTRKKIVLLNFIGNISQLTITVLFGILGIVFLLNKYSFKHPEVNFLKIILIVLIVVIAIFILKKFKFFKIGHYLKTISAKIYFEIISLSFLRYVFFSHQFLLLLFIFGVNIDYFTAINLVFCMYFIASIIPSLAIFDWVIKGSIAVWLFSFVGINELTILTITTLMWILNFAIPALIGSIFVLNFKLIKSE